MRRTLIAAAALLALAPPAFAIDTDQTQQDLQTLRDDQDQYDTDMRNGEDADTLLDDQDQIEADREQLQSDVEEWFAAHPRYAAEVDRQRGYFEHHCRAASIANATDISDAQPPATATTLPSAGRAAILIATADNPQKPVVSYGPTTWSLIPPAPDQPATVAVKAEADIPDLKMHATMTFRKNTDPTLQATHTIDLKFSFADGAPITGITDVGWPQMRKEDATAAEALTSVKVKISDTHFLIALAKDKTDTARNLDLMQTRSWFDFPLLLNDDRIANVVFQKSTEGAAMLDKAFDAWKSETPAPAAPAPQAKAPVGKALLTVDDLWQYKFAREFEHSRIAGGSAESRYLTTVYGMIKAHLHEIPELHVDSANKPGVVGFYLDKSGKLVGRKLISSSGSPNLDTAVMTAIAAAAPYPAPPSWRFRNLNYNFGRR
jgi:TonB family protein